MVRDLRPGSAAAEKIAGKLWGSEKRKAYMHTPPKRCNGSYSKIEILKSTDSSFREA